MQTPLSSGTPEEPTALAGMPSPRTADELVNVYFTCVHPIYPLMDKPAFYENYSRRYELDPSIASHRIILFECHILFATSAKIFELRLKPLDGVVAEVCANQTVYVLNFAYGSQRPIIGLRSLF